VYDVSTETKFFKNGTSFKKITYLIIPKQVGPLVLPSEDVSLFNPVIGEYYTKTIEEKNVNVKKGKDITSFSSSKLDLKKEKVKEETFEMFKNPFGFTFVNQLNSIYIWLVSIFIYFVTILSYLYLTFKEKDEKDSLLETYNLIMDNLKKDIKNKSWKDAGVKATRLIYLVVGTLSNSGQMTSTQIKDSFRALPPSLRKDIEKPLMQHLNFFEEVSFAPADFNETMKNKEKIQKAIKELDKLLIQSINLSFQKNN
jgi:hypothetical protein